MEMQGVVSRQRTSKTSPDERVVQIPRLLGDLEQFRELIPSYGIPESAIVSYGTVLRDSASRRENKRKKKKKEIAKAQKRSRRLACGQFREDPTLGTTSRRPSTFQNMNSPRGRD